MKVYGVEIPQSAIDATIAQMSKQPFFSAWCVSQWLEQYGVPITRRKYELVSYRAADRVIQQQRKAGNIAFNRSEGRWYWVKK